MKEYPYLYTQTLTTPLARKSPAERVPFAARRKNMMLYSSNMPALSPENPVINTATATFLKKMLLHAVLTPSLATRMLLLVFPGGKWPFSAWFGMDHARRPHVDNFLSGVKTNYLIFATIKH